jgi:hypothetical protein
MATMHSTTRPLMPMSPRIDAPAIFDQPSHSINLPVPLSLASSDSCPCGPKAVHHSHKQAPERRNRTPACLHAPCVELTSEHQPESFRHHHQNFNESDRLCITISDTLQADASPQLCSPIGLGCSQALRKFDKNMSMERTIARWMKSQ